MIKRISLILALGLFYIAGNAADTPEDGFWKSVSKSDVVEEYRLYIEQFPKGKYLGEAWRRVGRLEARQDEKPKQQPLIAGRYIDNGDGTVTDVTTKLQWMRCAIGQKWTGSMCQGTASSYKWEEARQLSNNFAGHSDWRLPKIEELRSLVYCSSGKPESWGEGETCQGDFQRPTIIDKAFPNAPSSYFWSGSPYVTLSTLAWGVYFDFGYAGGNARFSGNSVRLVRGGQ
jgi:hypothetical protein